MLFSIPNDAQAQFSWVSAEIRRRNPSAGNFRLTMVGETDAPRCEFKEGSNGISEPLEGQLTCSAVMSPELQRRLIQASIEAGYTPSPRSMQRAMARAVQKAYIQTLQYYPLTSVGRVKSESAYFKTDSEWPELG